MITNTSISVFNKYTDLDTRKVSYKKHLIKEVFWDDSLGINLNAGYENADTVNAYIPFDKNDLSEYKEPKKYNGTGWTLQNGDFMIKGEVIEDEVKGIKDLSAYEAFEITVVDVKILEVIICNILKLEVNNGNKLYFKRF